MNFIVNTGLFLYNWSVAGAGYIVSCVTDFQKSRCYSAGRYKTDRESHGKAYRKKQCIPGLFSKH